MRQDHSWREEAECRDCDSNLFFPDVNEMSPTVRYRMEEEAKAICKDCQVRTECLEIALRLHEKYGIWGGRTAEERRNIIRKRKQRLEVHHGNPS